jgi:hypothetical protein
MNSFVKNWVLPAVAGMALAAPIIALMNHYHVRMRIERRKMSFNREFGGRGATIIMSAEELANVKASLARAGAREENMDWGNVREFRIVISNWKARQ